MSERIQAAAEARAHDLEMRNNDLELRVHQLEGECCHLQADKAELKAENERLTRDIDMVQGFRTNQQKTIEALRAKLEAAEKELALQRYRCEVAERDVAHAHSEAKRRCPDYPWMLKTASEAVWALGESLLGVEAANKQWIAKAEAAEKEIELQRELFRREIERGNVAEARVEAAMGAAEDLERRAAALKQSDNEIAIATCNGLSSAAHQLRAALSTSEPSVGLSG